MITLFIDTASNQEIMVGLQMGDTCAYLRRQATREKGQVTLPLIAEILKKHHKILSDIDRIEVELGPGSFTGLRVGVAIANTLGSVLNIPINRKKAGELEEPSYS